MISEKSGQSCLQNCCEGGVAELMVEKAVLSRILISNEWSAVMDRRVTEELFQDEECKRCFRFIAEFYSKYGNVPSLELVEENFKQLHLTYAKEPANFYIDKMVENYVRNKGSELLMSTARHIVESPIAGLEKLQNDVANLSIEAMPTKDDFVGATVEDRLAHYLKMKNAGGMDGMPTPWEVLNEATMGLHAGDFITVVSRPGTGKTFMLVLFAEYAVRNKLKVLFVSNEMSNTQIMQRFDAIYFKLPYKELRAGLLPDALEKVYFDGLEAMKKDVNMIVTQDVRGVASIGSKIDQYKTDLVLVDGMYLLADDQNGQSRWESISNISRSLKKLARQKKVPIIATTQFNRASEVVKIDKVTLANLGFSDSIGQDADVVLGLFRTKDMEMNNELKIRMLKVREGEPKDFMIKWDLHSMDFRTTEMSDEDSFLPEDGDDFTISY
jgi:replicative DNA helicase